MLPLETRTDSPGETPEVHPRSMSALERNPQVPALTPHKVLGPRIDGRGNPRGPREAPEQLARGLPFLRPPERVPEVPVVSREHLPQLEKIQEVLPSIRDEANCTEAS